MYSIKTLKQMIYDSNKREFSGHLKRLKYLLSVEDSEIAPVPALANEYYEEARLCWYSGAFVATIIMAQLCLEELLRGYYRAVNGVSGYLNKKIKVDDASFKNLIDQAGEDDLLIPDEIIAFNKIRKELRNPYVHVKDFQEDNDISKPNFLSQELKINNPGLIGADVEDEAREAINILVTTFRKISRRGFPFI